MKLNKKIGVSSIYCGMVWVYFCVPYLAVICYGVGTGTPRVQNCGICRGVHHMPLLFTKFDKLIIEGLGPRALRF